MLGKIFNKGQLPVVERGMYFAARRHAVLANNVANANTPYFRPSDLPVGDFNATLQQAIASRDRKLVPAFEMPAGAPVREDESGRLVLEADEEDSGQLLFHDRSKLSIEKEMTRLTKNAGYHARMVELMRKELTQIRSAISGRAG